LTVEFRLGHRPWLDGLRGFALVMVVTFHEMVIHRSLHFYGWVAVDIFFCMSGFLITSILLEELRARGRISLKAFYQRRALRLLPGLYTFCAVMAVWIAFHSDVHANVVRMLYAGLYSANWANALHLTNMTFVDHIWTLATEEQFYLTWPITLVLLSRAGLKGSRLLAAAVGMTAAAIGWRLELWRLTHSVDRVQYGLDGVLCTLLVGCTVAIAYHFGLLPSAAWWPALRRVLALVAFAILVWVCLRPVTYWPPFSVLRDPLAALCVGAVLVEMVGSEAHIAHRVLSWSPLAKIGEISYGLYLYSLPIQVLVTSSLVHVSGWNLTAVHVVLIAVAGPASYYGVERRFLKRKKKLTPA
jgi:peptidoglycan/LPS O-acetylase OafA/YrhL